MIIAVVNEKGGVGKSTLAVHLAVWFHERGKRVALLDTDGQQSSSRWVREAEPGIFTVAKAESDDIMEAARALAEDYEIVIADGPANLKEGTRALMLMSDIAVIPVGLSLMDVEATQTTIRTMTNAQGVRPDKKPFPVLVINKTRSRRFKLTQDIIEAAPALGIPVLTATLSYSDPVADAPGQRTVLWRMGQNARKAAKEVFSIIEEVVQYVADKTLINLVPNRGTEKLSSRSGTTTEEDRDAAGVGTPTTTDGTGNTEREYCEPARVANE